jgi:hypothetical protein
VSLTAETCFCGCGRKLGFRARRVAGWAKMIDERVAELRPKVDYLEDAEERRALSTFLDRGDAMEAELLRFAHIKAGADPGDYPEANVCQVSVGDIKPWLTQANKLKAAARVQRDVNIAALGHKVLDSGMSIEDYTNAMLEKSARNVQAWGAEQGLSEQEASEAWEKLPPLEKQRIIGPQTP